MKTLRLPKGFVLAASTLTAAALCLGAGANAQKNKDGDQAPENWDPVEKGIHPSGDLYPVKYFTDDKGRLWMSPSPSSGETDGKELVFPERMREWRHVTSHLGLLGFIRLAFCGNQDLLSLTDAEYHFRKMKLPRTDVELRQRLVMEPAGKTPALQRRAEMDRLLAVRLLQQRGVKGAKVELERLASDAAAGLFVRVAAKEALASLLPEKFQVPARSKVDQVNQVGQKALLAMPTGCQVIATIDQALVP
ncbi:MAG: hypothetical protein V3U11_07470, partial [Planctomycetota bacterium]